MNLYFNFPRPINKKTGWTGDLLDTSTKHDHHLIYKVRLPFKGEITKDSIYKSFMVL